MGSSIAFGAGQGRWSVRQVVRERTLPWWLIRVLLIGAVLMSGAVAARAQALLPVPALTARVMDLTGTLNEAQRNALEAKLAEFERSSGTQLVVLMVPSTAPEDISAYANRVADGWKIGRQGIGDGLLLLVAKEDSRLRIEVARALEGAVTDLDSKRVMDEFITPAFKQGDFAGGLDQGVDALMRLVRKEGLPAPGAVAQTKPPPLWPSPSVLVFLGLVLVAGIRSRHGGVPFAMFSSGLMAAMALPTWWITRDESALVFAGFFSLPLSYWLAARSFLPPPPGQGNKGAWNNASWDVDTGARGHGGRFGNSGSGGFSSGGGGSFGGGGSSGSW